jgi:hypothetical protein
VISEYSDLRFFSWVFHWSLITNNYFERLFIFM